MFLHLKPFSPSFIFHLGSRIVDSIHYFNFNFIGCFPFFESLDMVEKISEGSKHMTIPYFVAILFKILSLMAMCGTRAMAQAYPPLPPGVFLAPSKGLKAPSPLAPLNNGGTVAWDQGD